MMRISMIGATLAMLLMISMLASAQTPMTIDQMGTYNFSATTAGDNIQLRLDNSPNAFYGLLLPCYGAVNLLVGIKRVPTPTANDRADYWDPNALNMSYQFPAASAGFVSTVVQANETYPDRPIVFQYIISADYNDLYSKFPEPGNNGNLKLSLANGGKSAAVKFTTTGNPDDTYSVYMFNGNLPKGAFPFTACGVQQLSATPVPNPNIVDQGNNVSLATFTGLDFKTPTGISIVVTRKGGYSKAYAYGILNSSSSYLKATSLLIAALIALVLFM